MKYLYTLFALTLLAPQVKSQALTAAQLLDKAIDYHDPNDNWSTFNGKFTVVTESPNKADRTTELMINLPEESFQASATRDSITTNYIITNKICVTLPMDSLRIANQETQPKRSHCEITKLYRNYYTYLYGLPMKLKDPGTIIDQVIEQKSFKGKEYLVLKASYEQGVGSDIWYFYFDPSTYAMEIYQFFKTDVKGNQKDDSGEYILLSGTAKISDIKMPRTRAWYYNKEDKYLGTDIIK